MDHSFNVEVAKRYGVTCAVFIQNLYFWIEKNEANGRHFYEDRSWTYNSLTALEALFPYFTRKQIRTVIDTCVASGAVIVGKFSQKGYDHTNWYTLTDEVWEIYGGNSQMGTRYAQKGTSYAQKGTDYAQKGTTITDSKPDSKPDIYTPYNPPEGDVGELFDRFWNAYPKKKAKGHALTAFKKLRPDGGTVEKMLAALEWQVKTEEWRKDGGQYIPYPATWLNGRRWEDAPDIHVGTIRKLGGQVIADRAEPSGKDIFAKPAARERRLKRK